MSKVESVSRGRAVATVERVLPWRRQVQTADALTPLLNAFRARHPKDDTSGCTSEAKAFSEAKALFDKAGAVVIGASKDSVASHAKFRAKYDLSITLASDVEGKIVEAYGAWVEKSMYGRKYMGIERSTFLIDGQGVLRRVWRKVKIPGHAQEVLKAVQDLG